MSRAARTRPEIRSDCDRCAALCCIAYAADESPAFAASKQAGEPCPKLDACGRCTIYAARAEQGFAGCIGYECFGAGQHVVQQAFAGRDWRDDPALLEPMLEAFRALAPAFEQLALADYARERLHDTAALAALDEVEAELLEIIAAPDRRNIPARTAGCQRRLKALLSAALPAPA